ncbi:MAG: AAA family ATPase [Pseudomonadota bacterium]
MSRMIMRREGLQHCVLLDQTDYRILLIEAQAGQGKTVLATQFDESSSRPFAWTTCATSDSVPRSFFEKLVQRIADTVSVFSKHNVLATIQQQLTVDEFVDIATRRLAAELEHCAAPLTIVIDDAHLLEESDQAMDLLRTITKSTPNHVKFIILSRFPLTHHDGPLFPVKDVLKIDKSLLAFTREEIAMLYNEHFAIPVDTRKVNDLLDATEGWIAGLTLLRSSNTIQRLTGEEQLKPFAVYFDELMIPTLTPREQKEVLLLSLLEEIRGDHMNFLVSGNVVRWVAEMVGKNCFARAREEAGQLVYRLHHIFRDYLSWQVDEQLSENEKQRFLVSAGELHLKNGAALDGLGLFVKARAWDSLARGLETHCIPLLVTNAQHPLMKILAEVPEEVSTNSPWICFAQGATLFAMKPAESEAIMLRALELCRTHEERTVELLTICFLINFNIFIRGEFQRKVHLLNRSADLFQQLRNDMSDAAVGICAKAIALGRVYYESNFDDAERHSHIAEKVFNDVADINPELVIMRILILGHKGDLNKALDVLSASFRHANSTLISPTTRFSLMIIQANYLLMAGRFDAYRALRHMLDRDWHEFMEHSYLGVFVKIWDIDLLIQQGRYDEAVQRILQHPYPIDAYPAHMTSQLKHYEMLAYAHLGRYEDMDMTMREALRLRTKSGGPYFIQLTHGLTMGALSLAGRYRQAQRIFDKYHKTADQLFQAPLIFSYRAAMNLSRGKPDEARSDVRRMLEHLVRFDSVHFFGWSPDIMKPVLAFAVREEIHPAYAKMLARHQMACDILDDGTIIPLLRIGIVNGVTLSLGNTEIPIAAITPMWQRIVTMLALAPHRSMAIQDIQSDLWPEQDPVDTRSKMDVTISRFRSKLSDYFGKGAGKLYLRTEGQRLRLAHCEIDCENIMFYAREGLGFASAGKPWRAHASFCSMRSWMGESSNTIFPPLNLPGTIVNTVIEALIEWVRTLKESNAHAEALDITAKALAADPINDTLQRERYNLLISLKRPGEAARSLKEYRSTLKAHDFSEDEIDLTIDNLLSGAA